MVLLGVFSSCAASITDAMKSAGARSSSIVGNLITENILQNQFEFACTPGNDVECTTAMKGANMVCLLPA
jgi:altronate hydrolase